MSGNDNYRPGLNPPEPLRKGGWLSSNIAQLMVFLNGLILTITAFATLSVFIDQIVKEGLDKVTDDVQQYVQTSYEETERSLHALSTVISLSGDKAVDEIKDYATRDVSGLSPLAEIYWVRGEGDISAILGESLFLSAFDDPVQFSDFVTLQASGEKKILHSATSLPHIKTEAHDDERIHDRYFAVIKNLQNEESNNGHLLALMTLSDLIDVGWLEKRTRISDLQIIDGQGDLPLYSYRKRPDQVSQNSRYTNIFESQIAGRQFDVKLDLMISPREAFLQKIPLLMLLFGITLTLIGTLYVRNNQTQSKKLSDMNKELAYKNFELSQEVGERERLNKVIQKSARENSAIINAVSDIIFEVGIDGKILFLNNAWNAVTGFELERSIGRNLFDLIYATDQDEQRTNFEMMVKGQKKSYRSFTRLRSADGTFRAIELAMSMMRQGENREMRVVGTITDVEHRRRAERALSEAEKKYRAIVENAAGGIYQVTPEGQFLSANPAMAKILGYKSPEEVLREIENAQEQLYVVASARSKFLNEISNLDMAQNAEMQIKRRDGQVIWVSENVRPVRDDEGTLLFYEGSMEDVDQRKKAEIALTDAKVESDLANRAKSEFLANMSHELRTPLNSIIGFSEIIKNESFGPIEKKEYKEYADNIYGSGNKLLRVINEILDVSRIEAGERTLNETVVNVKDTVKSCLDLMDTKIKANNMRVENKVQDPDLGFVGEAQSVKQMILNLMSNAVKFSPPNSFILLDAEIDSGGRLRLSITDTGSGMNDDELEKALSPFGQLDNDHKRAKSGTGLGLTLVKSLIELHGGALEIVSQKGIGTTATLIFPSKRVAQIGTKTPSLTQGEAVTEPKEV